MTTTMPPATVRFAPAVWILSILLLATSIAACLTALVAPELIHGPAVMVGSMRGTALVMLVLGIPLLVGAMAVVAARRGGLLAVVGWIAGLVFLTYQAWMFLFAVPFNGFFLIYVAMLASGFWAIVGLLTGTRAERVADTADPRMPARLLAGWMVASCVAFYALWLRNVVPALFDSTAPAFLDGTGMVTATNYVLDMAFFLPFTILAAVALWRRTPWGVVAGGAMLVVLALESVAIAVDQWAGSAADPASTVASAALTPMFAVVALIGAVMVGLWYRGTRRASERGGRSASARSASAAGHANG
jgi:hypothetical protein